MKNYRRILAGVLAGASMLSLAGCSGGKFVGEDARSLQLVAPLTVSEVKDYYAKSMDFDSIITRNVDVDVTKYELHKVTNEKNKEIVTKLQDALRETFGMLASMDYIYNPDKARYLEESTFHYIKALLNDKKMDSPTIISINEALGYYFVDVEAGLSARKPGTFTPMASLLGLNGAIHYFKTENVDRVDDAYMKMAVETLNKYYDENRITTRRATYDESSKEFSTDPTKPAGTSIDFTDTTATDIQPVSNDTVEPVTDTNQDAAVTDTEDTGVESGTVEGTEIQIPNKPSTEGAVQYTYFDGLNIRRPMTDVYEFNSIVGSSLRSSAYIPKLDLVYNIPPEEKEGNSYIVSGMGIMPAGIGGLTKFGFDRSQLAGKIRLRIVYKDELLDPDRVICTNIYPVNISIETGFSSNNDNVIPSFVQDEIEKLIDRADRAMINNDTMALMSGDIFADMGMAVQVGYERQYANVTRQISTFRRVISRNMAEKSYLVEIETQRQEGPKGADVYGTYRDKNYVVIQQVGEEFIITDWLNVQRQMEVEPDIDPDSAISKRLVALNLAGEVTDEEKKAAEDLIHQLYMACTARKTVAQADGQTTYTLSDGTVIHLQRGMYDCFNSNVEMLSSEKKEKLNSGLRDRLIKEGTDRIPQMNGVVTQWIGGANNQVEFMTEEYITYTGLSKGIYMQCYYLISRMEDVWVIDDIKIIEEEEHEGPTMESDVSRIGRLQFTDYVPTQGQAESTKGTGGNTENNNSESDNSKADQTENNG